MKKLSVCMIVKDEESVLEESLESIKSIADEIIITDTGSSDRTMEIAKKYADNIQVFKWINDFSAARNFCESFAQFKYILRWDADFILSQNSLRLFKDLKDKDFENTDLVYFNWILELGDNNKALRTIPNHFVHKNKKFHWEFPIHNLLVKNTEREIQTLFRSDIEVVHKKDRNKKKYRYDQTRKMLLDLEKIGPLNERLLFFKGEGEIFDELWSQAINTFRDFLRRFPQSDKDKQALAHENLMNAYLHLGKTDECTELFLENHEQLIDQPRFVLAFADLMSVIDIIKGRELFTSYLDNPLKPNSSLCYYDHERYVVHPHLMLAKAALLLRYPKEFTKQINFVINNTYLKSTIAEAILLKNRQI